MKEINHEYYVSLEVAKLLKESGFDWLTHYSYDLYLYNTEGEKRVIDGFASTFCNEHNGLASMPTLDVAQRWLREVKNLSVDIYSTRYSEWEYVIRKINQSNHKDNTIFALTACGFYTYEEAQESGIKNALEIILEEGE